MASVISAIGESRIDSYVKKLQETASASVLEKPVTMVRMNVVKEGSDMKDLNWVPPSLKELGALPESLGSFGSPWLLRNAMGSFRHGPIEIPFFGFGHFLLGLSGTVFVCAWPLSILTDLAVTPENGLETLAGMPKASFKAHMDGQCFHAVLHQGQCLWIPNGWGEVIVSLQDSLVSHCIVVPFMSDKLISPMKLAVRQASIACFCRWSSGASDDSALKKPWSDLCPAFLTWLRGNLAEENFIQDSAAEVDSDVDTVP